MLQNVLNHTAHVSTIDGTAVLVGIEGGGAAWAETVTNPVDSACATTGSVVHRKGYAKHDGVGLDSIDALEIGAALRKKYQVKFKANSDENRVHFRTIASLADFIAAQAGISIEG